METLSWLEHGVCVPWLISPPALFHQGASLTALTPQKRTYWDAEKERLVQCGAWERGGRNQYVTRAFLVPKGPGKWRLVVDLRHLNSFVIPKSTKFETLRNLRSLAKRNDYMFSFDLADGYYALALHPDDRKYFTVEVEGEYFQFSGLPMGWNLSPYVFCKTMRTCVQELRSPDAPLPSSVRLGGKRRRMKLRRQQTGMRVLSYVDDFLVLVRTRREALRHRRRVMEVLSVLGLRRSQDKGHWEVTQRLEHLGLVIDTQRGLFQVTEQRLQKINALARSITQDSKRRRRLVPARRLAQFTGLAQSVYLAVAPARFYLRELHNVTSGRKGWGSLVRLSKQSYRDLAWWQDIPSK